MLQRIHTFSVDYLSADDGSRYTGSFTVRRLSIMDLSKLRQRVAQLNGGYHYVTDDEGNDTGQGIDWGTEQMNTMLAHLEIAVQTCPPWWKLDELADVGLMRAVYDEVQKWEDTFRGRGRANAAPSLGGEAGAAGPGAVGAVGGGAGHPQASVGGRATALVGAEVSAALD
jgi:hypothetical protein